MQCKENRVKGEAGRGLIEVVVAPVPETGIVPREGKVYAAAVLFIIICRTIGREAIAEAVPVIQYDFLQ